MKTKMITKSEMKAILKSLEFDITNDLRMRSISRHQNIMFYIVRAQEVLDAALVNDEDARASNQLPADVYTARSQQIDNLTFAAKLLVLAIDAARKNQLPTEAGS